MVDFSKLYWIPVMCRYISIFQWNNCKLYQCMNVCAVLYSWVNVVKVLLLDKWSSFRNICVVFWPVSFEARRKDAALVLRNWWCWNWANPVLHSFVSSAWQSPACPVQLGFTVTHSFPTRRSSDLVYQGEFLKVGAQQPNFQELLCLQSVSPQ